MVSTLFLFHATYLTHAIAIFPAILCVIGSGPAMVLFTYAVSFMFTHVQSNRDFLSVTSMMVSVASASLVQLAFITHSVASAEILHCLFCTICPFYPLIGCLHYISKAAFLSSGDESDKFLWKGLVIAVVVPYLQCLLLLFLLRCLEVRYGGRALRNDALCRIGPRAAGGSRVQRSPGDYGAEDEDVQMERARVKEALTRQSCEEKPVLLVSDLRKEYTGGNEGGASPKRKKVAANNISFSVRKGEVLGLLGPNSSGKSTVIHLLAGDMEPTAGQVLIGGDGVEFGRGPSAMQHLGYCPQVSPLWPKVTLLEHLQIYAAIKGLHPRAIPDTVTRVVNALELKDHLHKRTMSLSAGIKRKLCFALSMLGNPQAVLLDEPSTGMDPKSKQRMWRALHAAFKSSQRGAVLSTHYMEEAEAVCDRVAILVSGRLRCIGSIQQLKGKYGRGYSLELKLREEDAERLQQGAELLHREILQIFPRAVRQESFESLMVYKVPVADVGSLAEAFSQLERVKQKFHFEEYHFSQSTLEQVFLEFAKQQESEEEEGAGPLGTSFRWQRLHQDGPDNQSESTVQQL
ncbi:hypothetical protein GJAV_G00141480 [Gymnothorax javanicus]|nr:hypothetical protein GJAV_G00141480 [Gymnothorax javanicus]